MSEHATLFLLGVAIAGAFMAILDALRGPSADSPATGREPSRQRRTAGRTRYTAEEDAQ